MTENPLSHRLSKSDFDRLKMEVVIKKKSQGFPGSARGVPRWDRDSLDRGDQVAVDLDDGLFDLSFRNRYSEDGPRVIFGERKTRTALHGNPHGRKSLFCLGPCHRVPKVNDEFSGRVFLVTAHIFVTPFCFEGFPFLCTKEVIVCQVL